MITITLCNGSGVIVDTLVRAVRMSEAIAILEHYILADVRVQAGTLHDTEGTLLHSIHA